MKKQKSNFYIVISVAVLMSLSYGACTKPRLEIGTLNDMTKLAAALTGDSATIYSVVWLSADQKSTFKDSSYQITAYAAFTDTITKNLVSMLGLTINSRTLTPRPNYTYYFGYSDSSAYLSEGVNLYGTNVSIKVTGSSAADTVTKVIYMPKKVLKTTTSFPMSIIDISQNLTVTWNTDPACSWGNVAIQLFYKSAASRFLNDSSLSNKDSALNYIVPDNGSYTISSTDLQKFKKNSIVGLYIARGSQQTAVLPVSKKQIFYYATSAISSAFLKLVPGTPKGTLMGCDTKTANSYRISLTNIVTNITTNYTVPFGSVGGEFDSIGVANQGVYNVTFTALGVRPPTATFFINGFQATGTSATINGVGINDLNFASIR